jgi:hypothetical protein
MNVHLPWLLLGVILLWIPRRWLRFGVPFFRRRRRKSTIVEPWRAREAGDPRVSFVDEFLKFRNYVDLLRAGVGSLVFVGGIGIPASLTVAAGATKMQEHEVVAIRAAILLVGLLLQTLRYEKRRLSFFPPIFYLAGLSIGLCDIRGAAFAFALIWAFNAALPHAPAFLTVYALLLIVFGHLFSGQGDLSVVYAGVLCFLPVLLSLLAKRPLTVMTRKPSRSPAST